MSFLLFDHLVWYSILLPTLPLEREIGPAVVDICHCMGMGLWEGLLWIGHVGLRRGVWNILGRWSDNFFIGPL